MREQVIIGLMVLAIAAPIGAGIWYAASKLSCGAIAAIIISHGDDPAKLLPADCKP